MVSTAICLGYKRIFLLIDRSVQELIIPVLQRSIFVAVLSKADACAHFCLYYILITLYNCLMVYVYANYMQTI